MQFEHVKVLPFVGGSYRKETPLGLPVMILGESHYYGEPLPADLTRRVVGDMLNEPWKPWMRFFARAVGVFKGGPSTHQERIEFFSSAIFYNYVQEDVGDQPRIRPTFDMWAKGEEPLWKS